MLNVNSLSDLLGTELVEKNSGYVALKAFADSYPLETTFNEAEMEVTAEMLGATLVFRADINQEEESVYQTAIVTHYPKEDYFRSNYCSSLEEAIDELVDAIEKSEEESEADESETDE